MESMEIKPIPLQKKMKKNLTFNEKNLVQHSSSCEKKMERHQSFNDNTTRRLSFSDKPIEIPVRVPEKKLEKQQSFLQKVLERQHNIHERRRNREICGKRGDTELHVAIRTGNLAQVKEILDRFDSDVVLKEFLSKQNLEGETAMYIAAENGHSSIVRELLKYSDPLSVAIKARNSLDSFHIAAKQGHIDVLRELQNSFPDLAMTTDSSNSTALHTAANAGHAYVVDLLLERDIDVAKIAKTNGKTALHSAARNGFVEVVRSLLSKDPNLGSRTDKKGQTALHMAVKGNSTAVILELIKPDPLIINLQDNKGNTALHTATNKSRIQAVQALLSVEGINVNVGNQAEESPLDIAEKYSNSEIIRLLKNAGATSTKDRTPQNPARQLKQTVSDIKHEVQSQLMQTHQTGMRVKKIAKNLKKLHISGLNNAINSATVVAVLIATVAFAAIFTVPGQFVEQGEDKNGLSLGQAHIAPNPAFIVFFVFDSLALFISLAVVVVQTSIVVIEQKAKKQLVFVINKLMWMACLFISIGFISLTYVVVGRHARWLAISATIIGGTIMLTTIGSMCYCVVMHRLESASKRRISESRSHSCSVSAAQSDSEVSYYRRVYAL